MPRKPKELEPITNAMVAVRHAADSMEAAFFVVSTARQFLDFAKNHAPDNAAKVRIFDAFVQQFAPAVEEADRLRDWSISHGAKP